MILLSVVIAKLCLKTVTEFLLVCAKLVSLSWSFYNNYCHLLGNERQSCIKYSTNKYQYQWSKYQYLTFKYQYKYCA